LEASLLPLGSIPFISDVFPFDLRLNCVTAAISSPQHARALPEIHTYDDDYELPAKQ
jgi:hypothetical protein